MKSWSSCPRPRALGMGRVGRGSVNPDHLESGKRTWGWLWRRRGESGMLGKGSEFTVGEGRGRERTTKGPKRGTLQPPVPMEATPPKASPPSWGSWLPSRSEKIELPPGTHRPLCGDQISWSNEKVCSPYPSCLESRNRAETPSLEVRLLNPVASV